MHLRAVAFPCPVTGEWRVHDDQIKLIVAHLLN